MRRTRSQYLPLARGWDDKAKEDAIEHFDDKESRETFFKFFKQLQDIYTILSPDAFLRPFIGDYQALASLYGLIRNAYADRIYVDKELTAKTQELLQQHTGSDPFALPGSIQELNANTLREVGNSDVSDKVKVLNLRKILHKTITEEGQSKPFLISIGERAEALTEKYENRQLTTQEALAAYRELVDECERASSEQTEMSLDDNGYAVYMVLKEFAEEITPEQTREINGIFDQFPDYQWNEQQERELRIQFYRILRPIVTQGVMAPTNALLEIQRV